MRKLLSDPVWMFCLIVFVVISALRACGIVDRAEFNFYALSSIGIFLVSTAVRRFFQ